VCGKGAWSLQAGILNYTAVKNSKTRIMDLITAQKTQSISIKKTNMKMLFLKRYSLFIASIIFKKFTHTAGKLTVQICAGAT